MSNVLGDDEKQQVLALGRLGWPLRRIEKATGIRRETASAYLKAAGIPIRSPGAWGRRLPARPDEPGGGSGPPGAKPANEVSTDPEAAGQASDSVSGGAPGAETSSPEVAGTSEPAQDAAPDLPAMPPAGRAKATPSLCEPYRQIIEHALDLGRNAVAIWQDLVDDHGFPGKYSSVKRFVRRLLGCRSLHAHPVILTAPGDEGQVDYGSGPMVRDPVTGKYRRTRLFTFTLGCSRKAVRILIFRSSSKVWAELHEQSFRRLGGAPRAVVLDNLREGVLAPDIYDPTLNPLYQDVLRHYGVVALPCRVGHPDRKGKVESGVGHAQKTPLRGLRFESLEEAQAYLDRWEERWADTRIHGTTKRQVAAMFEAEKSALLPLPVEPFRYYEYGMRTVHLDGCVEVDGAYYGAPPGYLGKQVPVQWDDLHVRILDPKTNKLLREHLKQKRGRHQICEEDRSPRTPLGVLKALSRARLAGRHVGDLCKAIHEQEGNLGIRRILGMLSLVKRHGATVVDDACGAAMELGMANYRFVRRYLDRRPSPLLTLRQVDPLIRELTHYRDVVRRLTKEGPS